MDKLMSNSILRECNECKIKKPLEDFNKNKDCTLGRVSTCKSCQSIKSAKRYQEYRKNPDFRHRNINAHFIRRYGISHNEVLKMKEEQDNKCAICHKEDKRLHLDHNHDTGQIRKMLCFNCNSVLGYAKENPEILAEAIKYLVYYNINRNIKNG